MKYKARLYSGADEVWHGSSDDMLSLLMASNRGMATFRQRTKGPVDGGEIWCGDTKTHTLKNEHWIRVSK